MQWFCVCVKNLLSICKMNQSEYRRTPHYIPCLQQLTAQPLGGEKPNGEALPQVALPIEDEVAAQSKNPISVLNEYGQTKGVTVKFDVLNQSGPPHNPRYVSNLFTVFPAMCALNLFVSHLLRNDVPFLIICEFSLPFLPPLPPLPHT